MDFSSMSTWNWIFLVVGIIIALIIMGVIVGYVAKKGLKCGSYQMIAPQGSS